MFAEIERQQLKFDQVVIITLIKDTLYSNLWLVGEGEVCQKFEAKKIPSTRKYIEPIRRQRERRLAQASPESLNLVSFLQGSGLSFIYSDLRCIGTV